MEQFCSHSSARYHAPTSEPIPGSLHIYTDGSCPDQHNVSLHNPAGWGVYVSAPFEIDHFGSVGHLPFPVMGSNNTAELQAILEALLLLPFLPAHTSAITLHTDSKYAYDLLLGLAIPSANPQLANLLLATFTHITSQMPVAVVKVKGHSGNLGNDRADSNAARGTTSSSNLGRYASFPPSPPILPPDPLTRWFSSLPLPAQTVWSALY